MITVCFADNHPVVHYGLKSFFKESTEISVIGHVDNFQTIVDFLRVKPVDVLLIDLELEGLNSISNLKQLLEEHSDLKIVVYTSLSETVYAPNAIKVGVSAFVSKKEKLERLAQTLVRVSHGAIIIDDSLKKRLTMIAKQNKNERLYRKLSNREIDVLRFLSEGKKNNEIAKLLDLNEKTISTYKLRLLTKLHVTNLVDLVNKAKSLDII